MKQCSSETMKNGFTFLEVIVAIFLITIGVGGAYTLIQQTIGFASVIPSKLVATYLAQEGIEIVRNIRDTNWLEESTWDDDLPEGTYRVDYQTQTLPDALCSGDYLKYDGNFYNCSVGDDTKFQREITISKPEAYILEISVLVTWQERGRTHQVIAEEHLYNWK